MGFSQKISMYLRHKTFKFLCIGVVNTSLAILIFNLFYFLLGSRLNYLAILVIAHFVSVFSSYLNFRLFVFGGEVRFWFGLLKAHLTYLVALLLQAALLYVAVSLLDLSVIFSQAVIALIVAAFSYFMHDKFTFKKACL